MGVAATVSPLLQSAVVDHLLLPVVVTESYRLLQSLVWAAVAVTVVVAMVVAALLVVVAGMAAQAGRVETRSRMLLVGGWGLRAVVMEVLEVAAGQGHQKFVGVIYLLLVGMSHVLPTCRDDSST